MCDLVSSSLVFTEVVKGRPGGLFHSFTGDGVKFLASAPFAHCV